MKFRFRTLNVKLSANPLCGESTSIGLAGLACDVYVDGELIAQAANLASGGFTPVVVLPYTTAANGIVVNNVAKENDEYQVVELDLPKLWDSATVRVVCTRATDYTFDNTFVVFGYDVGNNPNVNNAAGDPIDYNFPCEIAMIPLGFGEQVYSSFCGWRKPFTNDLYLFRTSSSPYTNITYKKTSDSTILGESPNIVLCCFDDSEIQQYSELYEILPCGNKTLIDDCLSASKTFELLNLVPDFSFNHSCQDGCCGTTDCIVNIATNLINLYLDINNLSELFVNDVEVFSTNEVQFTIEIYDCFGNVVDTQTITIDISVPINPLDLQVPFTVTTIGDYIVKVKMDVVDEEVSAVTCTKSELVHVCEYLYLEKLDCKQYKICNLKAGSSAILSIKKLNDKKSFDTVESIEDILGCTCIEYTFTEDGIYQFEIATTLDDVTETKSFVIVVDCFWKECVLGKITKLVCAPKPTCNCSGKCQTGECASTPTDLYDFNALMVNTYGYLSLLNAEYFNNYWYDILTPNKIDELFSIKQFLDRMTEYCKECTDQSINQTTSGCGCS